MRSMHDDVYNMRRFNFAAKWAIVDTDVGLSAVVPLCPQEGDITPHTTLLHIRMRPIKLTKHSLSLFFYLINKLKKELME